MMADSNTRGDHLDPTPAITDPPVLALIDHPIPPSTPTNDDGLLEDRYNKLKTIAIKYKKKIAELTTELENIRERSGFQNASKIQLEYDKALDEVERLKKLDSALQKDLQKTVEENIQLKMKESESSGQIQNLTASNKSLREKLDKLEQDAVVAEAFREKVANLEKELQEAKDNRVDAQQEKRQFQILSLEVTDYEKKLQDTTGALESKKGECEKLLVELGDRDHKVKELELTIANFKDSENKLILAKDSLQADSSRKAEKITFLQEEVGKRNDRLNEKKIEFDRLSTDFENAKATYSAQTKDLSEKLNSSQKLSAQQDQKISRLEENKRSRESLIMNLKLEMQQLESDYFNYKTKAQAMLKSQKPVTLIDSDETSKLQKVIQEFQSEVSVLKMDLQTQKFENENLILERADLNAKLTQLKADSIEKETQLNAEFQALKQDTRECDSRLKRQLEAKDVEIEQLRSSFQKEFQSFKQGYENQVQLLREQYELLKSESDESTSKLPQPEMTSSEGNNANTGNLNHLTFRPVPTGISPPANEGFNKISRPLTIDTSDGINFDQLRMIPRGEGEGSESVTSVIHSSVTAYTPRMDNYNVTFEQLLSTSFDSSSKGGSESDNDKTIRESLHHELVRCQHQITHLTSLLRESESNCDRLSQLSDALKEEIRRIERDNERQEHLKENTEYLKNVLLKFVTLTGDAERQRLIPVLKTMLKLTNDEVNKLEVVVKKVGRDPTVHQGAAGWSSYLPHWSGGGTGG